MKKINYNSIAQTFDARYNTSSMEGVSKYLKSLIDENVNKQVTEIGCGTGYWLEKLAQSGKLFIGLDYSDNMLKKARERGVNANLIKGTAAQLPFKNNSLDFLFTVNAIHLFSPPEKFILEASSSIKTGGIISVILSDIRDENYRWYVYDFFSGTFDFDYNRIPDRASLMKCMAKYGFRNISSTTVETSKTIYAGKTVFNDPFLKKNTTSTLAAIGEKEYQRGIAKIEAAIKRRDDYQFDSNIIFKAITGIKY